MGGRESDGEKAANDRPLRDILLRPDLESNFWSRPFHPAMAEDLQLPHELQTLSSLIEAKPESIAIGSDDFRAASLGAAKYIFDLGALFVPCVYVTED